MLNYQRIESKDNSQLKYISKLAKDSRFRRLEQKAVIYGEHLLIEAIKKNLVSQVFVLEKKINKYNHVFKSLSVNILLLNDEVMKKINVLDSEVEIVAIINLPKVSNFNINKDCIVLENIQDPGNLGTILRVANASGISQVVISANSVDLYNPKVLRASQGIQFSLDAYTDVDIFNTIKSFRGQILAMTPHADVNVYDLDLKKSTMLVFGNEGSGISDGILHAIELHAKIPMLGNTESINLAMAVTAVAFEMSRQRLMV